MRIAGSRGPPENWPAWKPPSSPAPETPVVALGLTLATQPRDALGRWLYLAAVSASLLGGLILTVLVVSGGSGGTVLPGSPIPVGTNGDLLRPLAVVVVLVASLWIATLAATRVERSR